LSVSRALDVPLCNVGFQETVARAASTHLLAFDLAYLDLSVQLRTDSQPERVESPSGHPSPL
jgi:hypothetical protein